jgi:hypothetical protein
MEIFGIDIIDVEDFFELLIRFGFNLLVSVILVRYLYYPRSKRKDYLFSYLIIGTVVFLLCFLLENVKLQLGFALGLFAIFGIIRYRTSTIPIKEMTYLFLIIGISVINALSNKKVSYVELLFTNLLLISITYGLEKIWLLRHESSKTILYERVDLLHPSKRNELIGDLKSRTGIEITRVEIGRINYLRDTARVRIYFYEDEQNVHFDDEENEIIREN